MVNNPRIYIAISIFLPSVGGAENQALAQGRSLRERGYEATIITLRHDRKWPQHEVIEGVPVMRVAGMLLGNRERLPGLLRKLLYLMAMLVMGWTLWQHRRRYDILHVYQLNLLALPTALVCYLTNKPMIIAVRSAGPGRATSLRAKASLIAGPLDATASWLQVDGKINEDGDLSALERLGRPAVRFTHFLLQSIHAVVVVLSSRMEDYLIAHGFNLPDIRLIPNGVDIAHFHPAPTSTSLEDRPQVVVCVSILRYEKGIDVLLQAWRLVQEQLARSSQAQLIIVGDGPLTKQLEHMAKALGIADSVEFAGLQSNIPMQFQRGDLAVLPSRFEGMPNAVLEAMACGLPCVATRVSGSEDIIQHGINGLLVEPQDYENMAKALLTLLCDPALAKKYGHAARIRIEQHYSFQRIMDMYVELYQRLVGSETQRTPGDLQSSSLDIRKDAHQCAE
jgi:glycosyltransferase involved in cell wall biosynthesis